MDGYKGQADPFSSNSEYNAQVFLINQVLRKCNTTTLVKIISCTNAGALSPVGFVDVQPLVNLVDGSGNAQEHGIIYHCLYFRMQGGGNAVIMDPVVGDIGICSFADRDISSVKVNKRASNPGSARRFDFSDGIYLGGVLNGTPTQYIQYSAAGIKISSPTLVNLVAPDVQINATSVEINATTLSISAITSVGITTPLLTVTGNQVVTGTLTNGTKNVGSTHTHTGVTTGIGTTGAPS